MSDINSESWREDASDPDEEAFTSIPYMPVKENRLLLVEQWVDRLVKMLKVVTDI